jgi:ABC-type lipoprotein release transport system permease subunit
MRTFLTAARFYAGYKLKALSLLVFVTLGLGLIMLGVDALYNSFNIFFDRPATYLMPRYFVSPKKNFDLLSTSYGIADIALKSGQREALAASLGDRFDLVDISYCWSLLQSRRDPDRRLYALVVGIDFAQLPRVFPSFAGKLKSEDIAAYKASPLILVERYLQKNSGTWSGEEFTLLSSDYFRDYNGIKTKVKSIIDTPMEEDDSLTLPIVYVDISQLKRLFALPSERGLPFAIVPRRPAHALSFEDAADMAAIRAAASPLGLTAYSVSTIALSMYKSYTLYRGIIAGLSAILVLVMMAAISASLSINFQNRRADFGLMKAFGCSDSRLLGFVLCESAISLAFPLALAFLANLGAGLAIKPFKVLYTFTVSPRASAPGALIILGAAILICLASSIQPYRYLKRIESVAIMREE